MALKKFSPAAPEYFFTFWHPQSQDEPVAYQEKIFYYSIADRMSRVGSTKRREREEQGEWKGGRQREREKRDKPAPWMSMNGRNVGAGLPWSGV
jgi:hypothetical protein